MKYDLKLVTVITFAAAVATTFADTAAVNLISPGSAFNNEGGYALGYEFTVGSSPVNITALGYYDGGSISNLGEDHEVGIYDTSGNLLVSGDVNSSLALSQDNYFAYTSNLSNSLMLNANTTYMVAGVSGYSDPYEFGGNHVMGSDITFNSSVFGYGNFLQFPGNIDGQSDGYYGGTFRYQAVPEPAPFAALGLGAMGLLIRRKKK